MGSPGSTRMVKKMGGMRNGMWHNRYQKIILHTITIKSYKKLVVIGLYLGLMGV